ncbi:DNA-binding transcriptional regulator, GntR family [Methylobacterium sp. UNC300MFChir4.1]|uniref:GntR family transcriptional regulator n=1 Tax=Methylobacterium TaxID=407 RepID=UPI00034CBA75|nr:MULTISPECIES: GntR family transcriptional regulator [unclassified Methylobacterium]KQS55076.1 GntR family transcriptional regulator [Methylobacterium sp. Leaf361]SEG17973.1 DNA-binding transcriptional regulator, GntR family [Methylobacterium sp. 190mf]SEH60838.1 DNA-binding transcriptional regulator, GntR family [Methylobacterium sp. 275MFSha3.1]SEO11990.1 DNA-binding transcriptional regulator, GntR family [Methylobacterium sp. UNC300MFChir4.1]SFD95612.1 DNA-binding transcriptional regulato
MNKIRAIQPDTLRQKVEDAVREAITSGVYAPGERLIERELCEGLGVSRASVREALRRLEAEKLVHTVPHRGPVVASISVEEARQLYALRAVLEGYAAHEFATQATDAAIAEFGRAAGDLREAAGSGDTDRVLRAKGVLYDVMLSHCGNDLVRETLRGFYSRINLLRATSLMHPERLPHSLAEIDALVAAFRARDAAKAEQLARLHVTNACAVALKQLAFRIAQTSLDAVS